MNEIKEIEVDGEKIHLKKSGIFGWSVVFPIKKDMNGKMTWDNINWKNFIAGGNWIKLLIIFFVVLIILGCIYEYSTTLRIANECLNQSKTIGEIIIR